MEHEHIVVDSDKHFSIDPVTRKIVNECGKVVLMQHDHCSERFTFSVPKEVDGHDMTQCNRIYIHYLNVELAEVEKDNEEEGVIIDPVEINGVVYAPTGTVYKNIDESQDVRVDPNDDSKVICSWLITRNATGLVGHLNFVLRFACIADDSTEVYGWSTDIYEGIFISPGIYNSEIIVEEYPDILEKWRAETIKMVQDQIDITVDGTAYARKTEVEFKKLQFNNISVAVSDFIGDTTYEDFPYRAAVPLEGVLSTMIPEVVFGLTDATSGNFAPVAESYDGGVYLYAGSPPDASMIIKTIICWKGNE